MCFVSSGKRGRSAVDLSAYRQDRTAQPYSYVLEQLLRVIVSSAATHSSSSASARRHCCCCSLLAAALLLLLFAVVQRITNIHYNTYNHTRKIVSRQSMTYFIRDTKPISVYPPVRACMLLGYTTGIIRTKSERVPPLLSYIDNEYYYYG